MKRTVTANTAALGRIAGLFSINNHCLAYPNQFLQGAQLVVGFTPEGISPERRGDLRYVDVTV